MKYAMDETMRRRNIQEKYNEEHGIIPKTIQKEIREVISNQDNQEERTEKKMTKQEIRDMKERLEHEMRQAAAQLDFERAMELRDLLFEMETEE